MSNLIPIPWAEVKWRNWSRGDHRATLLLGVGLCLFGCGREATSTGPTAAPPALVAQVAHSLSNPAKSADQAWAEAGRAHTEQVFLRFATTHAGDARAAKARTEDVELAWAQAQKLGTAAGCQGFLLHYPEKPHAAEARKVANGETVVLAEAIQKGWVRSQVKGDGLRFGSLTLNRALARRCG